MYFLGVYCKNTSLKLTGIFLIDFRSKPNKNYKIFILSHLENCILTLLRNTVIILITEKEGDWIC